MSLAYVVILGNKPGERIGIVKLRETGYYATTLDNPAQSVDDCKEVVAFLNNRLGLPEDVAESYRLASMFGWDKPLASAALAYESRPPLTLEEMHELAPTGGTLAAMAARKESDRG